jgi:hypothetical protein
MMQRQIGWAHFISVIRWPLPVGREGLFALVGVPLDVFVLDGLAFDAIPLVL